MVCILQLPLHGLFRVSPEAQEEFHPSRAHWSAFRPPGSTSNFASYNTISKYLGWSRTHAFSGSPGHLRVTPGSYHQE